MSVDDYLTVDQIAARIKKKPRWVLDRVKPSAVVRLPHHRFSRNRPPLFSPADVAKIDLMFEVDPAGTSTALDLARIDPQLLAKSRKILTRAA